MKDQYGRQIDYMRVSVTDRCNLRCVYCMPKEGVPFLPQEQILSFDEVERICQDRSQAWHHKNQTDRGRTSCASESAGACRKIKESFRNRRGNFDNKRNFVKGAGEGFRF